MNTPDYKPNHTLDRAKAILTLNEELQYLIDTQKTDFIHSYEDAMDQETIRYKETMCFKNFLLDKRNILC